MTTYAIFKVVSDFEESSETGDFVRDEEDEIVTYESSEDAEEAAVELREQEDPPPQVTVEKVSGVTFFVTSIDDPNTWVHRPEVAPEE